MLSLCLCEGFGLVPLEAMALGCVVLGFNGFGGRDYMRYGENCLTVSYPRLEGVLTELRRIVEHETEPAHAHRLRALSEAAMATAGRYGYARFRSDWENVLREFFA